MRDSVRAESGFRRGQAPGYVPAFRSDRGVRACIAVDEHGNCFARVAWIERQPALDFVVVLGLERDRIVGGGVVDGNRLAAGTRQGDCKDEGCRRTAVPFGLGDV